MSLNRLIPRYDGFDWDEFNSKKVAARIPVEIVEKIFEQEFFLRKDERHSLNEERFVAMGKIENRIVFVSYTIRKKGLLSLIRVISGRYVHSNSKEEKLYEEAKKIIEKSKS